MNKPSLLKQLRLLRSLLMNGWCRKSYARTKNNKSVMFNDEKATNFCILGGIGKITDCKHTMQIQHTYLFKKINNTCFGCLPTINDGPRGKKKVLSLIETTIKKVANGVSNHK